MLSYLISFLFPQTCLGCRTTGTYICDTCLDKIPSYGAHLRDGSIVAMYPYNTELVKKALWALKYRGTKEVAEILGDKLYRSVNPDLAIHERVLVVPIPTTHRGLLSRGFNQSLLLAGVFENKNPVKYRVLPNALIKKPDIKSQTSFKTRADRLLNMRSAFMVDGDGLAGASVLIIDDVTTTGATMREAINTLKKNGAKNIYAVAVAYQELFSTQNRKTHQSIKTSGAS